MADQRSFGTTGTAPAEAGTQVHDRVQDEGARVRDRAQEMVRHGAETAADYYQQGRQRMAAVEHTLEDTIRANLWPSLGMAVGLGMVLTLLWKKEETTPDYYQRGRQQVEDYYQRGRQRMAAVEHTLEDTMRANLWPSLGMAAGLGMVLTLLWKK